GARVVRTGGVLHTGAAYRSRPGVAPVVGLLALTVPGVNAAVGAPVCEHLQVAGAHRAGDRGSPGQRGQVGARRLRLRGGVGRWHGFQVQRSQREAVAGTGVALRADEPVRLQPQVATVVADELARHARTVATVVGVRRARPGPRVGAEVVAEEVSPRPPGGGRLVQ